VDDGLPRLWLDGSQVSERSGLDDGARWVVVSGTDSGTRGTCYFDGFESRRQSYIFTPPFDRF